MFYPLSPYPACRPSRPHQGGTVLLLTIMMLVLLTFEVAVISLVAQRGLGEEGMLQSQHIAARRGGETVLNQLENALYTYLQANDDTSAETAFNCPKRFDDYPARWRRGYCHRCESNRMGKRTPRGLVQANRTRAGWQRGFTGTPLDQA